MHMDTVGLSRGAADCSETNFTIISFGGGGETEGVCFPAFRKWQGGSFTAGALKFQQSRPFVFFFLFPYNRRTQQDQLGTITALICPREIAGGWWSFANRRPCICGTGHTESHFSLEVKLMNHVQVLHSIHIDEEICLQSLWISLMLFWAIVHDKHLNSVYKMAHKSVAWIYK